nr:MAG TPA: hypothetical protein [Caudoviricetes sp.]
MNGSGLLLEKHPLEKLNTLPSIGLGVSSLLLTHPEQPGFTNNLSVGRFGEYAPPLLFGYY